MSCPSNYGGFQFTQKKDTNNDGANTVKFADINGDKKIDLIVSRQNANLLDGNKMDIAFYQGYGDGTFSYIEKVTDQFHSTTRGPTTIAIGDLNNDGYPDVIGAYTDATTGTIISWFKNDGGYETFGLPQVIHQDTEIVPRCLAIQQLEVVDLNKDGFLDVVAACGTNILWYQGIDKNGNFDPKAKFVSSDGSHSRRFQIIDVNKDSYPDVVVVQDKENSVAYYKNTEYSPSTDGKGSFDAAISMDTACKNAFDITSGDFNQNGWEDIAVICEGDGRVVLYENNEGTFGYGKQIATTNKISHQIESTDVNRDGYLDVVIRSLSTTQNSMEGVVTWYDLNHNQGYVNDVYQQIVGTDGIGNYLAIGDLNGDGFGDVTMSKDWISTSQTGFTLISVESCTAGSSGGGFGTFVLVVFIFGLIGGLGYLCWRWKKNRDNDFGDGFLSA